MGPSGRGCDEPKDVSWTRRPETQSLFLHQGDEAIHSATTDNQDTLWDSVTSKELRSTWI
jgi:hypothetical protein